MKISDLLDVIEDDTVPIREKDIIASARIMEVTMAKIHTDASNNGAAKKKLSKGAIAAIVVAACLALSVTAFATGLVSRVVDWQGETIGEMEQPLEIPLSDEDVERLERTYSIIDEADSTELVLVKYTDENGVTETKSSEPTRTFSSVEEFSAALADQDSELQVFDTPTGYEFHSAQVTYDCVEGYEYALISTETDDSGLTVERYTLPPEGTIISSYLIDYRDTDGDSVCLMGRLVDTDVEFVVGENKTVDNITVDGMDSALVFEETDGEDVIAASLEMSKSLSTPIAYVSRTVLTGAYQTDGSDVFSKVWYSVYASGLDADTLMEILTF